MPPGDTSSSADTRLLAQDSLPQYGPAQSALPPATHGADDHEDGRVGRGSGAARPRRSRAPTPSAEDASPMSALNRSADSASSRTYGSSTVLSSLSVAVGVRRRHVPAPSTDSNRTISTDSGVHVGSRRRRRALPHDDYHLHQEFLAATAALAADVAAQIAAETVAGAGYAAAGSDQLHAFTAAIAAIATDVATLVDAEGFHPDDLLAPAARVAELAAEERAAEMFEAAETERRICAMLDCGGSSDNAWAEAAGANADAAGDVAGAELCEVAAECMSDPGQPQVETQSGSCGVEVAARSAISLLDHDASGDEDGLASGDAVAMVQRKSKKGRRPRPDRASDEAKCRRRADGEPGGAPASAVISAGSSSSAGNSHGGIVAAAPLGALATSPAISAVCGYRPAGAAAASPASGSADGSAGPSAMHVSGGTGWASARRRGGLTRLPPWRAEKERHGGGAGPSSDTGASSDGDEGADPFGIFAEDPEVDAVDGNSSSYAAGRAAKRGSAVEGGGPRGARGGAGTPATRASQQAPRGRPASRSGGELAPERPPPWRKAKGSSDPRTDIDISRSGQAGGGASLGSAVAGRGTAAVAREAWSQDAEFAAARRAAASHPPPPEPPPIPMPAWRGAPPVPAWQTRAVHVVERAVVAAVLAAPSRSDAGTVTAARHTRSSFTPPSSAMSSASSSCGGASAQRRTARRANKTQGAADDSDREAPNRCSRRDASRPWECRACGNWNYAFRQRCNRRACGRPRPSPPPREPLLLVPVASPPLSAATTAATVGIVRAGVGCDCRAGAGCGPSWGAQAPPRLRRSLCR